MATKSNIQWTDATWNVARGCSVVSEGCVFCYMMRDSLNDTRYKSTEVTKTKTVFNLPLTLKEPGTKVFTSSLTDFFHEGCDSFRLEAFDIIRRCPHLTFQILTKRPERIASSIWAAIKESEAKRIFDDTKHWLADWMRDLPPNNIWLGVTAENQKRANERIPELLRIPAVVHFASVEPMLEPVDLTRCVERIEGEYTYTTNALKGVEHCRNPNGPNYEVYSNNPIEYKLDWVIIGGESGFGSKPLDPAVKWKYRECRAEWIADLARQCQGAGTAVFVKQLGTHLARELGCTHSHGGNPDEWPEFIPSNREFPKP